MAKCPPWEDCTPPWPSGATAKKAEQVAYEALREYAARKGLPAFRECAMWLSAWYSHWSEVVPGGIGDDPGSGRRKQRTPPQWRPDYFVLFARYADGSTHYLRSRPWMDQDGDWHPRVAEGFCATEPRAMKPGQFTVAEAEELELEMLVGLGYAEPKPTSGADVRAGERRRSGADAAAAVESPAGS